MELFDAFEKAKNLRLYRDGLVSSYGKATHEFSIILSAWNDMCSEARLLAPLAAGPISVAEVEKMKHRGIWLEFVYEGTYSASGMPFDALLVEIVPTAKGFNVMRHDSPFDYGGRCFAVNLEKGDMNGVYEAVMNITNLF